MTEAILEEPEFLKELHKVREQLSRESKERAFRELKLTKKKYETRLDYFRRTQKNP